MPAMEALGLAGLVQHGRDIGEAAVHEHGFEKHGAEADLGQRIAEDRAVVRQERGKIGGPDTPPKPRKPGAAASSAIKPKAAGDKKHAAPAGQIADHTGAGRAEQVSGHDRKQQAAHRHLPFRTGILSPTSAKAIGTTPPAARPASTRPAASNVQTRRKGASQRRRGDDEQTEQHQPRLAEHIGERAEQRLHQRVRQREGGRQQRGGRRLDVQPDARSAG